jgi:hypothetical protein
LADESVYVSQEPPLVLIEWEDSAQPVAKWTWLSDWTRFDVVLCQSVGWLVHDGAEVKALAPNLGALASDESAQVSGVIRIPARCVKRVVRLEEASS